MITTQSGSYASDSPFQNRMKQQGQGATQITQRDGGRSTAFGQAENPRVSIKQPTVNSPVQPTPIVAGTYLSIVDGVVQYVGPVPQPTPTPTPTPTPSVTPTPTPTPTLPPTMTPTVTPTPTPPPTEPPTMPPTPTPTPPP